MFCLVLLLATPVSATWISSGQWTENKCRLCDQRIYYWTEPQIMPYMPSQGLGDTWSSSPGLVEKEISFTMSVCPDCYKLFNDYMRGMLDVLVRIQRKTNIDLIAKHNKETQEYHISEKEKRVRLLEEQIQKLKGEKSGPTTAGAT